MREIKEITISRFTTDDWSGVPVGIKNVPITIASRRKFHLMTEDSITLNFSLKDPLDLKVGDHIIDEVFGLFAMREKQLPTYNKATGGYDYQLRFDKAYWLWENHINMLTAPLDGADPISWSEDNGTIILDTSGIQRVNNRFPYKRSEAVWCLTNSLAYHVEQILSNILAANLTYYGRPYNARILPSATKAKEIRYISYDDTHICSALTAIANEFECEWWVTYESSGNNVIGWINFGKCELDDSEQVFELGENVETMQTSRDLTNYANRIYVFGGTENIPESYRKTLLLNIDTMSVIGGEDCWRDSNKDFNPYTMLKDGGTVVEQMAFQLTPLNHVNIVNSTPSDNQIYNEKSGGKSTVTYRSVAHKVGDDNVLTFGFRKDVVVEYSKFTAGISYWIVSDSIVPIMMELRLFLEDVNDTTDKIYLTGNGTSVPYTVTTTHYNNGVASIANLPVDITNGGKVTLRGGKTYKLVLEGRVEFGIEVDFGNYNQSENRDFILVTNNEDKITLPAGKSFAAKVIYNDIIYPITFNPSGYIEGEINSYYIKFDSGAPWPGSALPKTVELLDYLATQVESAWYTDDTDDPSSLISLGERRLRLPTKNGGLPSSNGIVIKDGYAEINGIVEVQRDEMVVKNDNIYPKCYLKVTDVRTEQRIDKMEYADGTEYEWPWTAYILQVELLTSATYKAFPFRRTYVKDGEKLKASFLSDYNEQKAYREMGVNWQSHDGYLLAGMTFEVAFREGSMEYTLIRNEDYGAKLPSSKLMPKVGDTFILTGWDVKAMDNLGLVEMAENQLASFARTYLLAMQADGWNFRCSMMSDEDEPLYPEGTKVEVIHDALSGGSKVSRIIGYELKLDIPHDSPIYEVGETEAYSRIKALERSLTNSNYGYCGNITPDEREIYSVTYNLDGVTTNGETSVIEDDALVVEFTLPYSDPPLCLSSVTVVMDGVDITSSAYDATTERIVIQHVTGNVTITASAGSLYDAEVEYLQSTGSQYIDTGIYPSQTLPFDCKFSATSAAKPGYGNVFGSRNASSVQEYQLSRYDGGSVSVGTRNANMGFNNGNVHIVTFDGGNVATVDGTTKSVTTSTIDNAHGTIILFGIRQAGSVTQLQSGKIYYCKFGSVRDYIPVRKGNVGYLYDKVSRKLFGNLGSGSFSYGNDITQE